MKPQWITEQSTGVTELCILPKAFMVAVFPKNSEISGFATLLHQNDIAQFAASAESFKSFLEPVFKKTNDQAVFRILGDVGAFAGLSTLFKSLGFEEGKHVSISTDSETRVQFFSKEHRIRLEKKSEPMAVSRKTRVLVVDDSETIRKLMNGIFSQDPDLECVATIDLPSKVLAAIEQYKPDVVTLDIHMPEMDGVTLLKKILAKHKIPTVMISSLSKEEGSFVLDALEAGAVDYIQKPSMSELKTVAPLICEKVKNARWAQVNVPVARKLQSQSFVQLNSNDVDFSYLITIGSSTGGTEALKVVLTQLPEKIPPILIVQHIPPVFSKAFADRMNQLCRFEVKEAEDGDKVEINRVLIAPGGKQMKVRQVGNDLRILIDDSPPVNRHKPSVDVLFDSVVQLKRKKVAAAILTGMGTDGAKGLLRLKQAGAQTLAQDEATSVVYGMPKEAAKLGGADKIVPIDRVAETLLKYCEVSKKKNAA